jgi:type II secretory pathway component PulC
MNKNQAISRHSALVASRRQIVTKTTYETAEQDDIRLREIDREVSVLGQAHNPRISSKAIAALILA